MISIETHKFLDVVKGSVSNTFRVLFEDSDVLVLKNLNPIDSSIYDADRLWCSEIIEVISASSEKRKLFKPGTGLDFKETDVREIIETVTNKIIYKA